MQAWRPEFELQNPHQGGRREQLIPRLPQTYDGTHTITNKNVLFSFENIDMYIFDKYYLCGERLEGRVTRAGLRFGLDTETLVNGVAPADSELCDTSSFALCGFCCQGEMELT